MPNSVIVFIQTWKTQGGCRVPFSEPLTPFHGHLDKLFLIRSLALEWHTWSSISLEDLGLSLCCWMASRLVLDCLLQPFLGHSGYASWPQNVFKTSFLTSQPLKELFTITPPSRKSVGLGANPALREGQAWEPGVCRV